MTYEQAKSVVSEFFKDHTYQYRVLNDVKGMTEHIDVCYGLSRGFECDMLIDRYVIEYRHVHKRADKERRIELSRVAPYMLKRLLAQQVKLQESCEQLSRPQLRILDFSKN